MKVTCYLYDREDSWGESWGAIAKKIDTFGFYPVFQNIDVTKPETWQSRRKFLSADLFTFVYFFSEIFTFLPQAKDCLLHILHSAKQGAVVLFIDNNDQGGKFVSAFEKLLEKSDFIIQTAKSCNMAFGCEEEKTDLEPYFSQFGWMKRESNLSLADSSEDLSLRDSYPCLPFEDNDSLFHLNRPWVHPIESIPCSGNKTRYSF